MIKIGNDTVEKHQPNVYQRYVDDIIALKSYKEVHPLKT